MTDIKKQAKQDIHELYDGLKKYEDQSPELMDITDVLQQVYHTLETTKNPEALVNKLTKYIYISGFKKITFAPAENKLLANLGAIGQRAGLNGAYGSDYSDKSQFYGYKEEVPRHS